jgi:hypothetical protein
MIQVKKKINVISFFHQTPLPNSNTEEKATFVYIETEPFIYFDEKLFPI